MDTIRCCIPLYGDKMVDEWKNRAQEYPVELAERIIHQHLSPFRIDQLSMHAQRGDPTSFYAQLSSLQQEVFLILLALNRLYFPTYKWLYQSLERMQIKPHHIGERFRQAFSSAYAEAIADMKRIVLETLGLVEDRHPDTDTTPVRRRLSYLRTPLKAMTFL